MVTDSQLRRLFKLKHTEKSIADAAMKSGMSENTAHKYLKKNLLPSKFCKKIRLLSEVSKF